MSYNFNSRLINEQKRERETLEYFIARTIVDLKDCENEGVELRHKLDELIDSANFEEYRDTSKAIIENRDRQSFLRRLLFNLKQQMIINQNSKK